MSKTTEIPQKSIPPAIHSPSSDSLPVVLLQQHPHHYTPSERHNFAAIAEQIGKSNTAALYNISPSVLDRAIDATHHPTPPPPTTRTLLTHDQEIALKQELDSHASKGKGLTDKETIELAKTMFPDCEGAFSHGWLQSFQTRHTVTRHHSSHSRRDPAFSAFYASLALKHWSDWRALTMKGLIRWISVDEKPVPREASHRPSILASRGVNPAPLEHGGCDEKQDFTLTNAATIDGYLLSPFITFKGSVNTLDIERWNPAPLRPAIIDYTESGWQNEYSFRRVLDIIIDMMEPFGAFGFIFDQASEHLTDAIFAFLKSKKIPFILVPEKMTDKLQVIDLGVNGPFQQKWDKLLNELKPDFSGFTAGDTRSFIMAAIEKVNGDLGEPHVRHGFQVTGLYRTLGVAPNDWINGVCKTDITVTVGESVVDTKSFDPPKPTAKRLTPIQFGGREATPATAEYSKTFKPLHHTLRGEPTPRAVINARAFAVYFPPLNSRNLPAPYLALMPPPNTSSAASSSSSVSAPATKSATHPPTASSVASPLPPLPDWLPNVIPPSMVPKLLNGEWMVPMKLFEQFLTPINLSPEEKEDRPRRQSNRKRKTSVERRIDIAAAMQPDSFLTDIVTDDVKPEEPASPPAKRVRRRPKKLHDSDIEQD